MKAIVIIMEFASLMFAGYFTMVGIGLMFNWGFSWVLALIMISGLVAFASTICIEKNLEENPESEG